MPFVVQKEKKELRNEIVPKTRFYQQFKPSQILLQNNILHLLEVNCKSFAKSCLETIATTDANE